MSYGLSSLSSGFRGGLFSNMPGAVISGLQRDKNDEALMNKAIDMNHPKVGAAMLMKGLGADKAFGVTLDDVFGDLSPMGMIDDFFGMDLF